MPHEHLSLISKPHILRMMIRNTGIIDEDARDIYYYARYSQCFSSDHAKYVMVLATRFNEKASYPPSIPRSPHILPTARREYVMVDAFLWRRPDDGSFDASGDDDLSSIHGRDAHTSPRAFARQ